MSNTRVAFDLKTMEKALEKHTNDLMALANEHVNKNFLNQPVNRSLINSVTEIVGNLHLSLRITATDTDNLKEQIDEEEFIAVCGVTIEAAKASLSEMDNEANKLIASYPKNVRGEVRLIINAMKKNMLACLEHYPLLVEEIRSANFGVKENTLEKR